jgi:AbrB family looped-hinge helix DNA binding protein
MTIARRTRIHDVRVGKRGTTVIPAETRHDLGLEEGDILALHVEEDGSLNLKPVPSGPIERLRKAFGAPFARRSIRDEDEE